MERIEAAREEHLYTLWQRLADHRRAFTSSDGRILHIIECGTRNHDAGPDFLNALVRIDGALHRGDVEIHNTPREWYTHHHHLDRRYNQVLLHLVFKSCPPDYVTQRQDGSVALTLSLPDWRPDTTSPDESASSSFSCALSERETPFIMAQLARRGGERFEQHQASFLELRPDHSWEQILYYGLLSGLGYGKNGLPFRRLAFVLPVTLLWQAVATMADDPAVELCEALLFGAAGLLEESTQTSVHGTPSYPARLAHLFAQWRDRGKIDVLEPECWQFFRLRPNNFPTRRLAAAAALAVRYRESGFLHPLLGISKRSSDPANALRALTEIGRVEARGYWCTHYHFGRRAVSRTPGRCACLVGPARSRNLVINVLLPILAAYAGECEDGHLRARACALYTHCPAGEESVTQRAVYRRLKLDTRTPAPVLTGHHAQGLLQLQQRWCGHNRCAACLSG